MNLFTPEQDHYIKLEVDRKLKEQRNKFFDIKLIFEGMLFGLGTWTLAFAYADFVKWIIRF